MHISCVIEIDLGTCQTLSLESRLRTVRASSIVIVIPVGRRMQGVDLQKGG